MLRRTLRAGFASTLIAAIMVGYISPVFAYGEIDSARTYSSKTFALPNSQRESKFTSKWIHYMDENGNWQDIKTSLRDNGDSYIMDQAPFTFTAPKTSAGTAVFTSTNRYDIFKKVMITDKPFSQTIQALGVKDVPGTVVTFNPSWLGYDRDITKAGNSSNDAVIYTGAYGEYNGDLIYWVNHAAAPRLDKLVRIPSNPNVSGDLRIPFKLGYSSAEMLKTLPDLAKLSPEDQKIMNDTLIQLKANPKYIDQLNIIMASRASLRKAWNEQIVPLLSQGDIAIVPAGSSIDTKRGIGLRDFYVWDSGKDATAHKEKITVKFELQADGSLLMTKIVPQSFLATATYPIFTDASLAFNSDAYPETSSVDGFVYGSFFQNASSWTAYRNGDEGQGSNRGGTLNYAPIYQKDSGNWYVIARSVFVFDTSVLGSGASVTAADLQVYGDNVSQTVVIPVNVTSFTPTIATDITGDFGLSHFGSTNLVDTSVNSDQLAQGAFQTFIFNSAGLSNISDSGVSGFSVRWTADITGTEPNSQTFGDNDFSKWMVYFADNVTNIPVLNVTYTAAPVATPEFSDIVYLTTIILCGYFVFRMVNKQNMTTGGLGAA